MSRIDLTGAPLPVRVLTLGESMGAIRSEGGDLNSRQGHLSIAGSETNVSIGLARLGHRVTWIGVLGRDAFGDLVERTLCAERVQPQVRRTDRSTGLVVFTEPLPRIVKVDYHRAGSAGSTLGEDDVRRGWTPDTRLVHLTGVTAALGDGPQGALLEAIRLARKHGAKVSFDVNYRQRLWPISEAQETIHQLALLSDIVFASESELALASSALDADESAVARELLDAGVEELVVTRGSRGASCHTKVGSTHVDALTIREVDPIGAGDAFVAGYLSAFVEGRHVSTRLQRGAEAGAFAVARRGDWEGLPRPADLALLREDVGATLR
ncbi:sugar kinase [Kribbella sp. NPDC003505]|uniref:sugar kinase n=1 Tax=Kribbella sp. NPDC003505 TaxID=3154448 RepID=UPI0033AE8E13